MLGEIVIPGMGNPYGYSGRNSMIKVVGLDGAVRYLNYFQILYIKEIPETKVQLTTGRYYLVRDSVESIQEQIVAFLHSCIAPGERKLLFTGTAE